MTGDTQVDDAVLGIEQAIADEHYRHKLGDLGWKHCAEPLCVAMRDALKDLDIVLGERLADSQEW